MYKLITVDHAVNQSRRLKYQSRISYGEICMYWNLQPKSDSVSEYTIHIMQIICVEFTPPRLADFSWIEESKMGIYHSVRSMPLNTTPYKANKITLDPDTVIEFYVFIVLVLWQILTT